MSVLIVVLILAIAGSVVWIFARESLGSARLDAGRPARGLSEASAQGTPPAEHGEEAPPARVDETELRLLTVEERVCRCSACGGAFVLRYTRAPHAAEQGNTVVRTRWVRCGLPSCHHRQPVILPINARKIHTREWLGSSDAVPAGPTLSEIMFAAGADEQKKA